MRLAFICSSLEPGRDGVGDYTRRLAGECIRQGHPCVLVGFNDSRVSVMRPDSQEMEGASIPVLRAPSTMRWSRRTVEVGNWLGAFNPDWLSLQFVPFGFHRKGLCFGLANRLAALSSDALWHVMFHELWLGLDEDSSFKYRFWGAPQRVIVRDLMRRLRPQIVHTQAEPYREALNRQQIAASFLPLFSNVPYVKGDGWTGLLEPLITKPLGQCPDRASLYLAGIFGAVHPEWDAEQAVNILLPSVQRSQRRLVLVFHGKSDLSAETFARLRVKLQNRAVIAVAGERTNLEISRILQTLDLGLATTPRQIIQKSGSTAAMLLHGLRVLVTRDDWRLQGPESPMKEISERLLSPKEFGSLKTLPARDLHSCEDYNVEGVAGRMLKAMELTKSKTSNRHWRSSHGTNCHDFACRQNQPRGCSFIP